MIDFLSGAVTLAYVVGSLYFVQFWKRTADRLFLAFALAFALLALNQVGVFMMGLEDERYNYVYILRVLGFALILLAIVDKNIARRRR
ncbi:MAG TPA: DUF5985 family protein [Burkholderiales bacterium]|jgi:hypothetical protein|nr:DUF5985 family protein [Burkholderiales bacterium]